MAKVRNAANTIRQGRIGENTWYVRDGVQVVRQRLQNSNYGEGARRSSAQQERRAKWGNLVNFYKAIKSWQPKAYESLKKGVTDYNAFMQLNANSTPVYLTRQLVEAGGAVIAPYQVAKGTLPSLPEAQFTAGNYLTIGSNLQPVPQVELTVAQLSGWLIGRFPQLQYGDNVAFVWFKMSTTNDSIPRVSAIYREITLDNSDDRSASVLKMRFSTENETSALIVRPDEESNFEEQAAVCIVTRKVNNSLQVSTERILTNGTTIYANYITEAAKAAAIASYGVDGDVPLAPGA